MKKLISVVGILWGLAFGILGAAAGTIAGFGVFGLYFFADTVRVASLIGLSAIIGFVVAFILSLLYWRNRESGSRIRIAVPIALIIAEILCGFLFLLIINARVPGASAPTITDSTLGGLLEAAPGTYHVIAKVKENTINCWCPRGMQCKLCVENGRLVLKDNWSELQVYVDLPENKPIEDLTAAQNRDYYLTISKNVFGDKTFYYVQDFEPYGPLPHKKQ